MMKPFEVIRALEVISGRNSKLALVDENITPELEEGMRLAFDPLIVFGVKKLPNQQKISTILDPAQKVAFILEPTTPGEFYKLCDQLQNRTLTGKAAQTAIQIFANKCSPDEWEFWYKRILQKDLKCGFAVSSWNAIAPIPVVVFQCQLALDTPEDDVKAQMSASNVFIEPKLDGVRTIACVFPKSEEYPEGKAMLFSRNGKVFENFTVIERVLLGLDLKVPVMLDGEIVGKNFQALMTQVNRKGNADASDSVFYVFDGMHLDSFREKHCSLNQQQRKLWLEEILKNRDDVHVVMTQYEYLKEGNLEHVKQTFDKFIEAGLEGLMMKDAKGHYTFERGTEWRKLKPFVEYTLTVLDVLPGSPGSKYESTMGALLCGGNAGDKVIQVSCGSGYSDQQRAQIWANHTGQSVFWKKKEKTGWVVIEEKPEGEPVVGKLVDVRGDSLTLSADSNVWSMRFPRWARFREVWDC